MDYTEIFHEVISVMEKDSATCRDMGVGDFQTYRAQVRNDMSEEAFTLLVKKYLASFGLEGHLGFHNTNMGGLDFQVMRYENALYVTNAAGTSVLQHRDKITKIDGQSIEHCSSNNAEFLMGETNERQGLLWNPILLFAKTVTVERDGTRLEIALKKADRYTPNNRYTFHDLGHDTLLIQLLDFADEAAIRHLYQQYRERLERCKHLIVDVRNNSGGADTAFFPLFEFCYPAGKSVNEFLPKRRPMSVNYSERNCEARLKMIDAFLSESVSEDVRPLVKQMQKQLIQNKGKGFLADHQAENDDPAMFGKTLPRKVWIITDQDCLSSGEAFVQDMSHSPKVTVVGRPTRGILDYSNCAVASWDQFWMLYPTSRSGELDIGTAMGHKGIPVDHYIPWSPLHLEKDVDLEYVLKQIEQGS